MGRILVILVTGATSIGTKQGAAGHAFAGLAAGRIQR